MQHHNRAPGDSGSPLSECAGKIMLGQLRSAAIALDKQNNLITCQSKVTIIISFAFHRCHQSAMSPYLTQSFKKKKEKNLCPELTHWESKSAFACYYSSKVWVNISLYVLIRQSIWFLLWHHMDQNCDQQNGKFLLTFPLQNLWLNFRVNAWV